MAACRCAYATAPSFSMGPSHILDIAYSTHQAACQSKKARTRRISSRNSSTSSNHQLVHSTRALHHLMHIARKHSSGRELGEIMRWAYHLRALPLQLQNVAQVWLQELMVQAQHTKAEMRCQAASRETVHSWNLCHGWSWDRQTYHVTWLPNSHSYSHCTSIEFLRSCNSARVSVTSKTLKLFEKLRDL